MTADIYVREGVLKEAADVWRGVAGDQRNYPSVVEQMRTVPIPTGPTYLAQCMSTVPELLNQVEAAIAMVEGVYTTVADNLQASHDAFTRGELSNAEAANRIWAEMGELPTQAVLGTTRGRQPDNYSWDKQPESLRFKMLSASYAVQDIWQDIVSITAAKVELDEKRNELLKQSLLTIGGGTAFFDLTEVLDRSIEPMMLIGNGFEQLYGAYGSLCSRLERNRWVLLRQWEGPAADTVSQFLDRLEKWAFNELTGAFAYLATFFAGQCRALHFIYRDLSAQAGSYSKSISTILILYDNWVNKHKGTTKELDIGAFLWSIGLEAVRYAIVNKGLVSEVLKYARLASYIAAGITIAGAAAAGAPTLDLRRPW